MNPFKLFTVRGFSLLELMVVLVIAGLIVTLTRPMYEAVLPGVKHRTEARALMTALRDSASQSIMNGRATSVRFAAEPASYSINGGSPVELTSELRFNAGGVTGGTATVVFYADGSSNGALIDLSGAARTYRIVVDWLTGDIHLSEHYENENEI